MLKKFLLPFAAFALLSCSDNNGGFVDDSPTPPLPPSQSTVKDPKPKAMWISGAFNLPMLKNRDQVDKYLAMTKETGITILYMDAKIAEGTTLCEIESLKQNADIGYDVVEYIMTKCDELDMQVIVGMDPLCVGSTQRRVGPAYESDRWDGYTQYKKVMSEDRESYTIVDIRDDINADAAVLDPAFPIVREYCANICAEVVAKYMHHKSFRGMSLDYVRYSNSDPEGNWYGYGDNFVKQFESETGLKIKDQNDFISAGGGFGQYFCEWIYFRTNAVSETIRAISSKVKEIAPECEIHLWASAQWASRYSVGQNWASKNYVPSGLQYIKGYEDTGFAEDIDVFVLGAYASDIFITDNPTSDWTVENFVTTYTQYIPKNSSTKVWGSLPAYAYDTAKMRDATILCLLHTDGLMVFDLGHVRNRNLWSGIKAGITTSGY